MTRARWTCARRQQNGSEADREGRRRRRRRQAGRPAEFVRGQAEAEDARDRARKAIRRIKKERRIAVDSLRNQFKWASIACMPFLVAIFGAAVSIRNRK